MSLWKQAVLCLVLVVAAAGGWYAYKNPETGWGWPSRSRQGGDSRKRAANRIPGLVGGGAVNVVTAPVELDKSGDTVMALGTAKAVRSVILYPAGHRRRNPDRIRARPDGRRPTRRS